MGSISVVVIYAFVSFYGSPWQNVHPTHSMQLAKLVCTVLLPLKGLFVAVLYFNKTDRRARLNIKRLRRHVSSARLKTSFSSAPARVTYIPTLDEEDDDGEGGDIGNSVLFFSLYWFDDSCTHERAEITTPVLDSSCPSFSFHNSFASGWPFDILFYFFTSASLNYSNSLHCCVAFLQGRF